MSELQELIKKIHISTANPNSYIYYDSDNGKIHKISSKNIPDDDYSIFPVATDEAQPILSGIKRIDEYVIFYDVSTKQVRLKEVAYDDTYNTASTMCYQLPVIKNSKEGHYALEHVYDSTDVFIYDITCNYDKGHCVWYNGNVYKLKTDILAYTEVDFGAHILFVKNVFLTTLPTQTHTAEKITMIPEYVGIHVDVWYKELPHLAGQHVWLNGTVYKIINDQDVDTEFTMDNAEPIISNVKLYADENKMLEKIKTVKPGDIILNNNNLFSIQLLDQDFNKDKISVFFYTSPKKILYYNSNNYFELELDDITETIKDREYIELDYKNVTDIPNGQIILSGKRLYQIQIDKEYDIIVQQNTQDNTWSIVLNPYTKKFLITSGYKPAETLYFSITSKYDPNILYRSLEFKVSDLLSGITMMIPFTYEIESSKDDVSIYTAKYFDTYAHEII